MNDSMTRNSASVRNHVAGVCEKDIVAHLEFGFIEIAELQRAIRQSDAHPVDRTDLARGGAEPPAAAERSAGARLHFTECFPRRHSQAHLLAEIGFTTGSSRRGDAADGGESQDHRNAACHSGKTDVRRTSSHYHRFMDKNLSNKVRRLSRMELPGAGQIYVAGNTAYVGHITNRAQLGTSILDVSDPREPRLLAQVNVEEPDSHSHKVRVIGDVMIVNVEQNLGALGRKGVDGSAEQTGYAMAVSRSTTSRIARSRNSSPM